MTSPIRTSSPATLTLARSTGAAMTSSRVCADAVAVPAASRAVARRRERGKLLPFPPPLWEGVRPQAPACAVPSCPPLPHKGRESRARIVAAVRIVIISSLAEQRGGGLQHLVGGADHLGVHLIGALRRDQVGNLGDDLDIGLLEIALLHVAKTIGVGGAVLGRARGRRLREQIVADRLQAGLVDEARQP